MSGDKSIKGTSFSGFITSHFEAIIEIGIMLTFDFLFDAKIADYLPVGFIID